MKATLYVCASVGAMAVAMPAAAQVATGDPLAVAQPTDTGGSDGTVAQPTPQASLARGSAARFRCHS